jgi:hypothetical protein
VSSAILELYANFYTGGGITGNYPIYKLSRAWAEDTADWTNASTGQTWSAPGGDYVTPAVVSVTCPRSAGNVWIRYNVLSAVTGFVSNPATNFGFLIINTSGSQEIDYISSENSSADLRPKLTIAYQASAAVTENAVAKSGGTGLSALAQGRDLHLYSNNATAPITVDVFRPDGSRVLVRQVAPLGHVAVSGLGAGVYLVAIRTNHAKGYIPVSLAP